MALIMKARYFDKKTQKFNQDTLPNYILECFKKININFTIGSFNPLKHACVFKCLTGIDIFESMDPLCVKEVAKIYQNFTEYYKCCDDCKFFDLKFNYNLIDQKFIVHDLDRYVSDYDLPTFREIFELSKFFDTCVWYFLGLEY